MQDNYQDLNEFDYDENVSSAPEFETHHDYNKYVIQRPVHNAQKKIVGIFLVLGTLTLFFGIYQFFSRTYITPKELAQINRDNGGGLTNNNQDLATILGQAGNNLEVLDTDNDGINDADEANLYGTSPYLEDTDSDGITDREEIETGTDPLCAEGGNCVIAQGTNYSNTIGDLEPVDESLIDGDSLEARLILGDVTPDEVRQILIRNGAPQEDLDQIDDETLMQIYNEFLYEAEDLNPVPKQDDSLEDYENLTIDEIRQLLIDNGADEQGVNELSDDQIRQVYQESISKLKENSGQ